MGLIFTEAFESGSTIVISKTTANGSVSNSVVKGGTPRTGSGCVNTGAFIVTLGAADQDDVVTVGAAFRSSAGTAVSQLFYFQGDGATTTHVTVYIADGATAGMAVLRVYRGTSAGTLLGTSSEFARPSSGTYFFVEAKVKLHDSTGTVDITYAGNNVLALTGQDTKNAGTAAVFDTIAAQSNTTAINALDDFYITNEQGSANTGFLGVIKVETIRPTGNGNSSVGVGSDGNSTDNYLLVDDVTTSADYVDFAATGDKDTYVFGDISTGVPYLGGATVVKGVMVCAYAQKTDAASRSLITVARLSATEADSAAMALNNGSPKLLGHIYETKPGGGTWTLTDANNAEFGVKAGA